MTDDMRQALDERRELIETRAEVLLDTAHQAGESWTKHLGEPPRDQRQAAAWRHHGRTVVAYRDRYGITDGTPLGPTPEAAVQKIDAARAKTALDRARDLTTPAGAVPERSQGREPLGRSL